MIYKITLNTKEVSIMDTMMKSGLFLTRQSLMRECVRIMKYKHLKFGDNPLSQIPKSKE
jgi:hypothetical protein